MGSGLLSLPVREGGLAEAPVFAEVVSDRYELADRERPLCQLRFFHILARTSRNTLLL